ncbi:MAG: hypothetical protein LBC73_00710 [Oscillospiraceae bacterium]|nr:hypothetical protein [Oscillospiraceae bacterium]
MRRITATILIVFILILTIPVGVPASAEGEYKASFIAELDADFNSTVGETPDLSEFDITFDLSRAVSMIIEFDSPVRFGDLAAIDTNIPFPGGLGVFTMFRLDGREVPIEAPYLSNAGIDGGMRLTLWDKNNNNIENQPVDLPEQGHFTKLEIRMYTTIGSVDGNAWIGGTFSSPPTSAARMMEFKDQSVPIKIGIPFTAALNMGSDKIKHDSVDWGFLTVVQTDLAENMWSLLDASISQILVDGAAIPFNNENIRIGYENGVRISITDIFADDIPVVLPDIIVEFSVLEVMMEFTFRGFYPVVIEPPPTQPPETPPPDTPDNPDVTPPPNTDDPSNGADVTTDDNKESIPWWFFLIVALGIAAIVLVVVGTKKPVKKPRR